jgi:hypothetical protein
MTEQLPGELICEYTIQSTGVTSYGVPPLQIWARHRRRSQRRGTCHGLRRLAPVGQ